MGVFAEGMCSLGRFPAVDQDWMQQGITQLAENELVLLMSPLIPNYFLAVMNHQRSFVMRGS